jgi:hypothetical protein
MKNVTAWAALNGTTPAEKLASLGITEGNLIDIREMDALAGKYGIRVFLFFEKDLVHTRTIEQVLSDYQGVSEYERPYIRIDAFLRFTKENDPSFEQTMREFPLMIEIAGIGEMVSGNVGTTVPYVTGLLPFLDELDVDDRTTK